MSILKLSVKITDPPVILERRIKQAISDRINLKARDAIKSIKSALKPLIEKAIKDSPEYISLKGGQLQAEFGVRSVEVDATTDYMITRLVDTIKVDFKPMKTFGRQSAVFTVSIFPKLLVNDLIAFSSARYKTKKGSEIPWLKWLLTLGDKIIVRNYVIDYTNAQKSRTGLATMKKARRQGWRVPPQFSGTRDNNFITRAFDNIANFVDFTIQNEFRKAIQS